MSCSVRFLVAVMQHSPSDSWNKVVRYHIIRADCALDNYSVEIWEPSLTFGT